MLKRHYIYNEWPARYFFLWSSVFRPFLRSSPTTDETQHVPHLNPQRDEPWPWSALSLLLGWPLGFLLASAIEITLLDLSLFPLSEFWLALLILFSALFVCFLDWKGSFQDPCLRPNRCVQTLPSTLHSNLGSDRMASFLTYFEGLSSPTHLILIWIEGVRSINL
jgi:hypothetical protein